MLSAYSRLSQVSIILIPNHTQEYDPALEAAKVAFLEQAGLLQPAAAQVGTVGGACVFGMGSHMHLHIVDRRGETSILHPHLNGFLEFRPAQSTDFVLTRKQPLPDEFLTAVQVGVSPGEDWDDWGHLLVGAAARPRMLASLCSPVPSRSAPDQRLTSARPGALRARMQAQVLMLLREEFEELKEEYLGGAFEPGASDDEDDDEASEEESEEEEEVVMKGKGKGAAAAKGKGKGKEEEAGSKGKGGKAAAKAAAAAEKKGAEKGGKEAEKAKETEGAKAGKGATAAAEGGEEKAKLAPLRLGMSLLAGDPEFAELVSLTVIQVRLHAHACMPMFACPCLHGVCFWGPGQRLARRCLAFARAAAVRLKLDLMLASCCSPVCCLPLSSSSLLCSCQCARHSLQTRLRRLWAPAWTAAPGFPALHMHETLCGSAHH